MCSISYEPCTEQSFRIGQRNPLTMDPMQVMSNANMGLLGSGMDPMATTGNLNRNKTSDDVEGIT